MRHGADPFGIGSWCAMSKPGDIVVDDQALVNCPACIKKRADFLNPLARPAAGRRRKRK